ncbi:hypothetical protein [Deinococcus aluminii]|uniref:hypothetical protein n=1 Tax=Deinococcus aluminii TaxID=1656885 RepID=UPI0031EA38E2
MKVLNVLSVLDSVPLCGLQQLTLRGEDGTATLYLEGPNIVGVESEVLPDLGTALTRAGLDPMDVDLAEHEDRRVWPPLLRKGLLAPHVAHAQFALRVTQALLPLAWQDLTWTVTPLAAYADRVDGLSLDTAGTLYDMVWLAMTIPGARRADRPSTRLRAVPASSVPEEVIAGGAVYLGVMHGWTLGQVAARLGLRWDDLSRQVNALVNSGLLCPVPVQVK